MTVMCFKTHRLIEGRLRIFQTAYKIPQSANATYCLNQVCFCPHSQRLVSNYLTAASASHLGFRGMTRRSHWEVFHFSFRTLQTSGHNAGRVVQTTPAFLICRNLTNLAQEATKFRAVVTVDGFCSRSLCLGVFVQFRGCHNCEAPTLDPPRCAMSTSSNVNCANSAAWEIINDLLRGGVVEAVWGPMGFNRITTTAASTQHQVRPAVLPEHQLPS